MDQAAFGLGLLLAAYGLATVFAALVSFALLVKVLLRLDRPAEVERPDRPELA